jgi:hypothetical protein
LLFRFAGVEDDAEAFRLFELAIGGFHVSGCMAMLKELTPGRPGCGGAQ